MNIILDTHVLLWILTDDRQLSKKSKQLFLSENSNIYVSVASIWEMAIKVSIGKLNLRTSLKDFIKKQIEGNDIRVLSVETRDILPVETLPFHHKDPFDRLIISQCMSRDYRVLSADKVFDKYPVKRVW